ncbi:MAG: hypothetical protein WA867_01975, partial [Candidatus Acidiferrales bacterium]
EVLIEEMFGSDRIRPKDYRRAVVIDAGPKNTTNKDTLRSERRSALINSLTESTLLSRWEKLGRGGTEDETVKPLDGVQRVQVPHGQSEQAGR